MIYLSIYHLAFRTCCWFVFMRLYASLRGKFLSPKGNIRIHNPVFNHTKVTLLLPYLELKLI